MAEVTQITQDFKAGNPVELFTRIKNELAKADFTVNGMSFDEKEKSEIQEIVDEFLGNNAINLEYPELLLSDLLIWLLENGTDLNILVGVFFLFQKVYKDVYKISETVITKINAKLEEKMGGI